MKMKPVTYISIIFILLCSCTESKEGEKKLTPSEIDLSIITPVIKLDSIGWEMFKSINKTGVLKEKYQILDSLKTNMKSYEQQLKNLQVDSLSKEYHKAACNFSSAVIDYRYENNKFQIDLMAETDYSFPKSDSSSAAFDKKYFKARNAFEDVRKKYLQINGIKDRKDQFIK